MKGGTIETTWATHTEYLLRSSMGTMLKSVMPMSFSDSDHHVPLTLSERVVRVVGYLGAADADDEVVGLLGAFAEDLHVSVVKWLEPPDNQGVSGIVVPGH